MKQVLNEKNQIHYVYESDIIEFITANSDISWNTACDLVVKLGITSDCNESRFWKKNEINDIENPDTKYWIKAFFDTHPWIDRMMIVFR